MSFIGAVDQGVVYTPGYFLAHEECERKTREFAQSGATTAANGAKYWKMGAAYPSNDGYAEGLVYEDVDVTNGNMPGSVVLSGVVYEDRLPITGADYDSVTLKNLVSPKAEGWQERSGSSPDYVYADSTDETVNTSKTYYLKDAEHTAVSDYAAVLNPVEEGWYESDGAGGYELSDDTEGDKTKTYYSKTDVRLAAAAKSALEGKGFKFVTSAPAVTRPNWVNGGTN